MTRAIPTVDTALAGSDYVPMPVHPAPSVGTVTHMSVTDSAVTSHTVNPRTSLVLILVQTAAVRFLQGAVGDPADHGLTLVPGYHSYAVTPGAALRFQALSGTAALEIVEA